MKRKILSVIVALAMVFSVTGVSFAATSENAIPTEKVKLEVTSGGTNASVVATSDYVVKAAIGGTGYVDPAAVTAALTMTDVAGLGVEGTRNASYTLTTGLESRDVFVWDYIDPRGIEDVRVNASVNGVKFGYDIEKTGDAAWTATPDDADAVAAAWAKLTSYILTGTGEEDGKAEIKAGTQIQVGNCIIKFVKDLTADDLNAKGDDMTGQVLDAVTYETVTGQDTVCKVTLPEGSAIFVGSSYAILNSDATINVGGLNLKDVSLDGLQAAANDKNLEQMILETLKLANVALDAVAEAEEITVDINIVDKPVEKVRLDVTSGGTDISAVATADYVVKVAMAGTGFVDAAAVSATLTMRNVAGLGVEGERTASYTLETGLASKEYELAKYFDPSSFEGVNVEASVNGFDFAYEIAKTGDAEWTATPEEAAAVSAAWQKLTSYVTTGTGEEDSKVVIQKGTKIQVGNCIIEFVKDLTADDLNAKGDDMTGQVLDAVTYKTVKGDDKVCQIVLPEGSAIFVGSSYAILDSDATIDIGGLNLKDVSLDGLQAAANDKNLEQMILETLKLANVALEAVNEAETITVDINIVDKPAEKVRLDVTSGGTEISAVATADYVVKVAMAGTGYVDASAVSATLTMKDVAGLGVEGERTASYTLETGLASKEYELAKYFDPSAFEALKINASVNDNEFVYNVAKTDDAEWTATPEEAAAVSAAWQVLTSYVTTGTGEEDSKIEVLAGTEIQIGNNIITFVEDFTGDDFNAKGDDMTGQILKAVEYDTVTGQDEVFTIKLPAGSALYVGSSYAYTTNDAVIDITGLNLKEVSLDGLQAAANAKNLEQMILETLKLANVALEAVTDVEEINVDITFLEYCDRCGAVIEGDECEKCSKVERIAGLTRYATALEAADALKVELGVEEFENIVVASGKDFPDALSGSYLAAQKAAPMLLINSTSAKQVRNYINDNLAEDGTVYVLGGKNAVKADWMKGVDYERLGGDDRYATNIKILKEAGVEPGAEVTVCTGKNFADSLSVSATGNPILLVGSKLTSAQDKYLKDTVEEESYYIIGGTKAVSKNVEKALKKLGNVERIAGDNRYDTSTSVAYKFYDDAKFAVIARGDKFPDGLAAGPLAYSMDAPVLLVNDKNYSAAATYTDDLGIKYGKVIGGKVAIKDSVAVKVFGEALK